MFAAICIIRNFAAMFYLRSWILFYLCCKSIIADTCNAPEIGEYCKLECRSNLHECEENCHDEIECIRKCIRNADKCTTGMRKSSM